MRLTTAALVLALATALAACAGGDQSDGSGPGAGGSAVDPAPSASAPSASAPAASAPVAPPAAAAPAAGDGQPYASDLAAHAGLRIDCQADSECAVKDVGNCCGRYDACVRADAQPDPAAVQAECAAMGLAGICGFPVIEACVCSAGTCQAAPSDGTGPDQAVR